MTAPDPYRRIAPIYDRLIEPFQAGVRKKAFAVHPPQEGWEVLDVGCGTGTGLAAYVEAGCEGVGVDVSKAMLEQAAARLGDRAELHRTDGETLPFEAGRFDLVTVAMVLHEVRPGSRGALLGEMARVSRPEGRVLIIDFRFGSKRGWKGPVFGVLHEIIERVSGHHAQYRSFRAAGGVPELVTAAGLTTLQEKIVAGGNLAIYVVQPH